VKRIVVCVLAVAWLVAACSVTPPRPPECEGALEPINAAAQLP